MFKDGEIAHAFVLDKKIDQCYYIGHEPPSKH